MSGQAIEDSATRISEIPLLQAEVEEARARETFDSWCWLLSEVCLALEPITPDHGTVSVAETKDTIETAIELLSQLNPLHVTAFAGDLTTGISGGP